MDNDDRTVAIRNPILTGFLIGVGVLLALTVAAVVWFSLAALAAKRAADEANAARIKAEQNVAIAAAMRERAEAMIAEEQTAQERAERRNYQALVQARARESAIDNLEVTDVKLEGDSIAMKFTNNSLFPIIGAQLAIVVRRDGEEIYSGEFGIKLGERILEDQSTYAAVRTKAAWRTFDASDADRVTIDLSVVDITIGER